MNRIASIIGVIALLFGPGLASATKGFLSENSRQGKNLGQAEIHREIAPVNAGLQGVCVDSCLEHAADIVVAPKTAYKTLSDAQAAYSAKGIPLESTSPVPIPKGTTPVPKNYSGDKVGLTYEWTEGGYKYTARLHEATPGAPADSPISWVVERVKPGQAGSKKLGIPQINRIEEVLVPDGAGGTKWISMSEWERLKQGFIAGTLTPEELKMLSGAHFGVPPQ